MSQQPYLLALLPSDILLHLSQFYLDDRDAMSSLARCDHLHNRILMNGYNRKTQIHYYPICDYSSHTDTDTDHHHTLLSIYDIAPSHPSFRLASSSPILTMIMPREYSGNEEQEQAHTHVSVESNYSASHFACTHLEGTCTIAIPNARRIGRLTRLTIERIWTIDQVKRRYPHSALDPNEIDKEQYIKIWWEKEEEEKQNEAPNAEQKEAKKVTLDDNTKKKLMQSETSDTAPSVSDGQWLPRTLESLCIHEYNSILSLLPPSTAFAHLHRLHTIKFIDESPFYLENQQSIVYPHNLRTFIHATPTSCSPEHNVPSQFNFTFPNTITELTLGRQYFQEERFRQEPSLIPLPPGLVKFHFDGMTTHALDKWTNLPSTLTELRFDVHYRGDENFSQWIVPSNLRVLHLGQRFNQSLVSIKLPNGLTSLTLSSWYRHSLIDVRLPHSLRVFQFTSELYRLDRDEHGNPIEFTPPFLPDFRQTQLERLELPVANMLWNVPVEYLRLPKTLKTLILSHFNHPVDELLKDLEVTPLSPEPPQTRLEFGPSFRYQPVGTAFMKRIASFPLTYLNFGAFTHTIDTSISLPPTLKHLHFNGELAGVSLKGLKLPPGLETFNLGYPDTCRYRDDYPDLSHTRITVVSTPHQWRSLASLLLPVTLTHLQFGASFDLSISEFILPSSLRILKFGRNFTGKRGGWFKHPLPSTLTQLDLSSKFVVPIGDLSNTAIKSLALPTKWNASVDTLKLPSTLESLQFGRDFNQSISLLILPGTLTSLTLGSKFNDRPGFAVFQRPSALRQFNVHNDDNQEYNHALPSLAHLHQLESLILPDKWNRPLHELNLHRVNEQTPNASLTLLQFGEEFNQPIIDFQFPSSLRTLRFESQFNQPVAGTRLPSSITELRFGSSFSQPLSELVLPRQLSVLQLGHSYNASFLGVRLPPRLEELTVGKSGDDECRFTEFDSLMSMSLPRSLKAVYLPSTINNIALQLNDALRLRYEEYLSRLKQFGISIDV